MGRTINIPLGIGGGSPADVFLGELTCEPTIMHEVGTLTVLPAPTRAGISNGLARLTGVAPSPAGPEPAWAYRMVARDAVTGRAWSWLVGVPEGEGVIEFVDLPRFTTAIPPQTTGAQMQNWADTAATGAARAEQAAAEAQAPTDQMVGNLVSNPGSVARQSLDQVYGAGFAAARETSATITFAESTSPAFTYEVITVHGALKVPGLVGKRFGQDYEKQGTNGSGFKPTTETPQSVYRRTGADLVVNASGWVTDTADPRLGEIDGAQIKDGVIYHDFNPAGSARGTDGIGFRADGSAKVYSSRWGDSAASMLADGIVNCFSFGPAYMVEGAKQAVTGTAVSSRQILGTTEAGDLVIVSTAGATGSAGISYPQAADLAQQLGLYNAVALDGGGSVQTLAAGNWVHPSTDAGPRAVADFLVVNTRIVGDIGTSWVPLEPKNTFTAHAQTPKVRTLNGAVYLTGAMASTTATAASTGATLPWWAAPSGYQRFPATTGSVQQYYDVSTNGDLILYASAATGSSPRYLSAVRYPAKTPA